MPILTTVATKRIEDVRLTDERVCIYGTVTKSNKDSFTIEDAGEKLQIGITESQFSDDEGEDGESSFTPPAMKGLPIAFITAALLALAFLGFSGLM